MINDVVLEGIVFEAWKYADELLFRLACYRAPDLPQKPLNIEAYDRNNKRPFQVFSGGEGGSPLHGG